MKERYHLHVHCGGRLVFHHATQLPRKGKKPIEKTFYLCKKCNQIVNIIRFPSYEELIMTKQLWVKKHENHKVRKKWKKLEEIKKRNKHGKL